MPEANSTKQVRIAVVDDETILLQTFSSLMRQLGYEADFFSSPLRAVEGIVNDPGRYQLVLADIKMPEMDGITFVKRVRFVLPHLPIVFMTGGVSDEVRDQAIALGNVVFLEKPFPLESTLKDCIQKLLATKGAAK